MEWRPPQGDAGGRSRSARRAGAQQLVVSAQADLLDVVAHCDSTTSERDSTKARNEEKPSAFSLNVESIRCIWLFTPELLIHSSSLFSRPTRTARTRRAVASACSAESPDLAVAFLVAFLAAVFFVAVFLGVAADDCSRPLRQSSCACRECRNHADANAAGTRACLTDLCC